MNQPKKHIKIDLKTLIQDDSDKEENQVLAKGLFFRKGGLDVINFKEKIDDAEIATLITIQAEKVAIKRTGAVSMHQQFRLGQSTENVYRHPHGNIYMETFTDHYSYRPLEHGESALLEMRYTVILNGEIERKHKLKLEFTEEDAR